MLQEWIVSSPRESVRNLAANVGTFHPHRSSICAYRFRFWAIMIRAYWVAPDDGRCYP